MSWALIKAEDAITQSVAEHGRPELHELRLVEITVLVLIEHVDEVPGHRVVETHPLLNHRRHLLRTQNAVAVLVELVKTRSDVLVPECNKNPINSK